MTYGERYGKIQKLIEIKSNQFVSLDLYLYASKNYLKHDLFWTYNQIRRELNFLHAAEERLTDLMLQNGKSFLDEMPVVR